MFQIDRMGLYRILRRSELDQCDRKACPVTASYRTLRTELIDDVQSRFPENLYRVLTAIGTTTVPYASFTVKIRAQFLNSQRRSQCEPSPASAQDTIDGRSREERCLVKKFSHAANRLLMQGRKTRHHSVVLVNHQCRL